MKLLLSASDQDMQGCLLNCSSHGVCSLDRATLRYACACEPHFDGHSCSQDTRPCSSSPCMHMGQCLDYPSNGEDYLCLCEGGVGGLYSGSRCEIKRDVCYNETCSANGVCKEVAGKPECQCFAQFSGKTCLIRSTLLDVIRITKTLSLSVAIAAFASVALVVLFLDAKFCKNRQKAKNKINHRVKKFVYVN